MASAFDFLTWNFRSQEKPASGDEEPSRLPSNPRGQRSCDLSADRYSCLLGWPRDRSPSLRPVVEEVDHEDGFRVTHMKPPLKRLESLEKTVDSFVLEVRRDFAQVERDFNTRMDEMRRYVENSNCRLVERLKVLEDRDALISRGAEEMPQRDESDDTDRVGAKDALGGDVDERLAAIQQFQKRLHRLEDQTTATATDIAEILRRLEKITTVVPQPIENGHSPLPAGKIESVNDVEERLRKLESQLVTKLESQLVSPKYPSKTAWAPITEHSGTNGKLDAVEALARSGFPNFHELAVSDDHEGSDDREGQTVPRSPSIGYL
eukprot:TRINITY_DN30582_c0_g1_i1.p1 TRINITY_DN30582_c0_g1~~TRINITY_DN30582_c0_g1_i1.p1  ORF type:complete len:340 (+),score=50.22 TRINITY_DN30582_c0_g1_i1:58-1020(+)